MMDGFMHLRKPAPTNTPNPWWYVETVGAGLYLLNTGRISSTNHCRRPMEELYFDNESEAYAAIDEYYEFNKQRFPFEQEQADAMIRDGYTVAKTVEETVEPQVMEFV